MASEGHKNEDRHARLDGLSRAELRELFNECARDVVNETFGALGIDLKDQRERNRLRDNLVWVDGWRNAVTGAVATIGKASIVIVVGGFLAALLVGIRSQISGGH